MQLKRNFHPVGHGAFYTERIEGSDGSTFTVVFDCGRFETAKTGWSYYRYKAWIDNYINTSSGLRSGEDIDILFISHFHTDHIIGVDYLLKNYNVKKVVLPVISPILILDAFVGFRRRQPGFNYVTNFLENCLSGDLSQKVNYVDVSEKSETMEMSISDFLKSQDSATIKDSISILIERWYYKPFYRVDAQKEIQISNKISQKFPDVLDNKGIIDNQKLIDKFKSVGPKPFKKIYEDVFGEKKHNSYSLTLFSGTQCKEVCRRKCHISTCDINSIEDVANSIFCVVNCLYMGDYEALNSGLNALKNYYFEEWSKIGLFQVPHHGSEHNSDTHLYCDRERICVISADSNDKYNHPDQPVLDAINQCNSIPIIVSELPKTKQEFIIHF